MSLYSGIAESPRTSLVGFVLMVVFFMQVVSGLALLSFSGMVGQELGLIANLHRVIPSIIVLFLLVHMSRAFFWHSGIGSRPVRSGLVVLFILLTTLATGYIASGGEAGFWGGVISFSPVTAILASIVETCFDFFYRYWSWLFTGLLNNAPVVVTGTTSITTALYEFSLVWHVVFGIIVILNIFNHAYFIHGSSTTFGGSAKELIKVSLATVVEARDFRFCVILVFLGLAFQPEMVWLLRLGNAPTLSTEIKAPNKATTELYLSSFYDVLRQYPILIAGWLLCILCVFFVWLYGLKQARLWSFSVLTAAVIAVLNRSMAGFITQDIALFTLLVEEQHCHSGSSDEWVTFYKRFIAEAEAILSKDEHYRGSATEKWLECYKGLAENTVVTLTADGLYRGRTFEERLAECKSLALYGSRTAPLEEGPVGDWSSAEGLGDSILETEHKAVSEANEPHDERVCRRFRALQKRFAADTAASIKSGNK